MSSPGGGAYCNCAAVEINRQILGAQYCTSDSDKQCYNRIGQLG